MIECLTPERTGDYDKEVVEYVDFIRGSLCRDYGVNVLAYKIVGSYGTERFDKGHKSDIDIEIIVDKIPKVKFNPMRLHGRDFMIHDVTLSVDE